MADTIERELIVKVANRMIKHLSQEGTNEAQTKREAIIMTATVILQEADAYKGFFYIEQGSQLLKPPNERVWDATRIAFN